MSEAESPQVTSQGCQTTIACYKELLSLDSARRSIADHFEFLAADQVSPRLQQVNLDLRQVERITSEGLNKLIQLNSLARHRGIRLVLVDVQDAVREVFALTRLERMFEFQCSGGSSSVG